MINTNREGKLPFGNEKNLEVLKCGSEGLTSLMN